MQYKSLIAALAILTLVSGDGNDTRVHVDTDDSFSSSSDDSTRVYNGEDATYGEFPFMAYLLTTVDGYMYQCGGSIISERWILTAAHCMDGASSVTVTVGKLDSSMGNAQEDFEGEVWEMHEDYDTSTLANDIALIKLNRNITFGDYVSAIALPTANDGAMYDEGAAVTVIGWGGTESASLATTLQKLPYEMVSTSTCQTYWGSSIYDGMVCTGSDPPDEAHSWAGDSGGPLFGTSSDGTRKQVALVSWGVSDDSVITWDVNTDVLTYVESGWIGSMIGSSDDGDNETDDSDDSDDNDSDDNDSDDNDSDDNDSDGDDSDDGDDSNDGDDDEYDDDDRDEVYFKFKGNSSSLGIVLATTYDAAAPAGSDYWGVVCNDGMGRDEAAAMCKYFGYDTGILIDPYNWETDSSDLEDYYYRATDVDCPAGADDPNQCDWTAYENAEVPCVDGQQMAVSCADQKFELEVYDVASRVNGKGKAKMECSSYAYRYGQFMDLKDNFESYFLNRASNGTYTMHAEMKYKKNSGIWKGKGWVSEIEEDDRCFICMVYAPNSYIFSVAGDPDCAYGEQDSDTLKQEVWELLMAGDDDERKGADITVKQDRLLRPT